MLEGEIVSVGRDALAVQRVQMLETTNAVLTSSLDQSNGLHSFLIYWGIPPRR